MNKEIYTLGPITVLFIYETELHNLLPEHIQAFAVHQESSDSLRCYVRASNTIPVDKLSNLSCSYSDHLGLYVYSSDQEIIYKYPDGYISMAVYNIASAHCILYIDPNKDHSKPHIFESTPMQMLLMTHLNYTNGFLLHSAAALYRPNEAICLCGKSGNGKTTMCKLLATHSNFSILTDETVLVWPTDDGTFIYGTHWKGSGANYYYNAFAKLSHIFFIEHGAYTNKIIQTSLTEAFALLAQQAFPYFWSSQYMVRLYTKIGNLLNQTPHFRYGFLPNSSAVDTLRGFLN